MKFQTPKGTRDLMPDDAARFQNVWGIVVEVFENYGFRPLYTPAFESFDLLMAKGGLGEAVKDEVYFFQDKSSRDLALRFDLTMPLARVVASNPQMPKPFKRYSFDRVWRYDNPQAMRWREFWQADIDTIGSKSVLADAEVVAAACECLDRLGFKDYYVRVNNRKFLDSKIGRSVPKEKIPQVFRILDKLDKIGEKEVLAELKKIACDTKDVREIIEDKEIAGKDEEILELIDYLKDFGFDGRVKVDASLVRGLDYYTGLVFEIFLGAKVSCGGGGRYDNLIGKIGGQQVEAVGISLGIDRIIEVMREQGIAQENLQPAKIFVANVDDDVRSDAVKVAQRLRREGIACQINLTDRYLSKQLEFANAQGIRYVLIVGKEEIKMKRFKLRDMENKTQKELGLDSIVSMLKEN